MAVPQVVGYMVTTSVLAAWGWRLSTDVLRGLAHVRRLHQIPCSSCQFYTGSSHLKCPVHPYLALTEEAINCEDFEDEGNMM